MRFAREIQAGYVMINEYFTGGQGGMMVFRAGEQGAKYAETVEGGMPQDRNYWCISEAPVPQRCMQVSSFQAAWHLGLALASACIRSEKSHTGKKKEHPTEQTHHVTVPNAGYYKE